MTNDREQQVQYRMPFMRRIEHIHFVGIGGSGMCGIAEILHNQGYTISGSDISKSTSCQRLESLGITINIGHVEENVHQVDVVVASTAIDRESNPEILYSLNNKIPVVPRAEMLAELMRYRMGIAVAGTHGKTTTTSLLATVMGAAGLDPTYVIGGRLNNASSHAYLGESHYFVAEADESDASFLHLQPQISIVTNIERDHMETYNNSTEKMLETYLQFLHNLPYYGLAVVCIDDPLVQKIMPDIARSVVTYGFSDGADYQAHHFRQKGTRSFFQVTTPDQNTLSVALGQPGTHNVLNALACIAVAKDIGIENASILQSLESFGGVARRFEVHQSLQLPNKDNQSITMVDDYGHHPTEVEKTLAAARNAWPGQRLVMLFQPHRYSRTRDLYEDFVNVLSEVDVLLLLDVHSAGEQLIAAADSKSLAGSIRARGKVDPLYIGSIDQVNETLSFVLMEGDILITQGAGSIGQIAHNLTSSGLQA